MRDDEKAVVADFAAFILEVPDAPMESRAPPEPDARVYLGDGTPVGVEVTSFFDTHERQAGYQESAFLVEVNEAMLAVDPPPELRFRLVMQEDGREVLHRPAPGMEQYPTLARWLDGVFIERAPHPPHETVVLNQRQSPRPPAGLFPRGQDVMALAKDLSEYSRHLIDSDFALTPVGGPGHWPPTHHVETAKFETFRTLQQEDGWAHPSLDRKLTNSNKYLLDGLASAHLVIHNFVPISDIAFRLWHSYSHHREAILSHLAARAAARKVDCFEEVWFLDYSDIIGGVVAYRLGSGVAARVGEWKDRAPAQ